jgi:hypothetical protein
MLFVKCYCYLQKNGKLGNNKITLLITVQYEKRKTEKLLRVCVSAGVVRLCGVVGLILIRLLIKYIKHNFLLS